MWKFAREYFHLKISVVFVRKFILYLLDEGYIEEAKAMNKAVLSFLYKDIDRRKLILQEYYSKKKVIINDKV